MLVEVSCNCSEGLPHPRDETEVSQHQGAVEEDCVEFVGPLTKLLSEVLRRLGKLEPRNFNYIK